MEFVIITGQSGAGKSQANKVLEDMGYYCIDNFPSELVPPFTKMILENSEDLRRVALVMDIRGRQFFEKMDETLNEIKRLGITIRILYLEADKEILIKRFKETRRSHPLDPTETIAVCIDREKELLESVRAKADYIINTSRTNLTQLRAVIYETLTGHFSTKNVHISIMSFGFKKGLPMDSDMVFDLRFLPNPYYIEALRPLSGNDKPVQEYVMAPPESQVYFDKIKDMVIFLIQQCVNEARGALFLSLGCTGGQHRSVTVTNLLATELNALGYKADVCHRDVK